MKASQKYKSYRKKVGGPGEYKKQMEPYMDYPKHKFPDPKLPSKAKKHRKKKDK